MFKKPIIFILLIFLVISSCTKLENEKPVEITVVDAFEREIAFSEIPTRIVIAGKQTPMLANFAYLFHGKSDRILAIENRAQSTDQFLKLLDSEIEDKLILEKNAGVEQIVPLEPDLVILKTVMKEQLGDQLESIGIPVVYVSFESVDEIYRDLAIFGILFDEKEKMEEINEFYETTKNEIDGLIDPNTTEPNVLLMQVTQPSDERFVYNVPAESWLQTQMVLALGGNPVWTGGAGGGWGEVNLEQIFAWQPENIMVINYQGKGDAIVNQLLNDPVWMNYIEENDVLINSFPYDFASWDQPDPRWILGYASIAHRQYPDNISSDYMIELTRKFYSTLFDIDDAVFEGQILTRLDFLSQ